MDFVGAIEGLGLETRHGLHDAPGGREWLSAKERPEERPQVRDQQPGLLERREVATLFGLAQAVWPDPSVHSDRY